MTARGQTLHDRRFLHQSPVGGSWVHKLLVATSGAEALQLFASHPVDLVLLDDHHAWNKWGCRRSAHESWPTRRFNRSVVRRCWAARERVLECVDASVSKSEPPANLLQIVEHLLDLRFLFAPLDGLTGGRGRRAA